MKRSVFTTEIIIVILAIFAVGWFSARKFNILRAETAAAVSADNLKTLQDALHVYRWENENRCPSSLQELVPLYIEEIPASYKSLSEPVSTVKYGSFRQTYDASGGWIFSNNPADENYCEVFLNI